HARRGAPFEVDRASRCSAYAISRTDRASHDSAATVGTHGRAAVDRSGPARRTRAAARTGPTRHRGRDPRPAVVPDAANAVRDAAASALALSAARRSRIIALQLRGALRQGARPARLEAVGDP